MFMAVMFLDRWSPYPSGLLDRFFSFVWSLAPSRVTAVSSDEPDVKILLLALGPCPCPWHGHGMMSLGNGGLGPISVSTSRTNQKVSRTADHLLTSQPIA